ncbi:MAG TPA: DNA polymerase III subunit delta [Candidatus Faecalibacterium intestinigallinarum]|uniref:DNA-directed DNA polymerase n=1 Tax=Candidatus Faecalibacterium intestinigallinarum TaxID=2838581 RepID=A0A9D1QBX9_9FIRM|nr:DNA polymerase III subunit delta [Candidatus Faecalibacterium intestinigallinarum]
MPAENKLAALVEQGCPVFYFYSTEPYLVRRAVGAVCALLARSTGEEVTVLDGATPDVEQLITAAGTISFFGTKRVVCLPELDPAAYSEKDLETFADTVADVENAVLVFGSVFEADRTGKAKPGKRAQRVIAQCRKLGWAEELARPGPTQLRQMMAERAAAQGAELSGPAGAALLERCGEDPYLLENEVDKLAAAAGYRTITPALVAEMGVVSLEADVFEMVRLVTARSTAAACKKLHILLRLGQEPIAITAALIGSYVDLYRVKLGQQHKKSYSAVFKDFGYKGSDYRLKRSAQTAAGYTLPQLKACLDILLELDKNLKGQPVSPQILLETALCRLAMEGGSR